MARAGAKGRARVNAKARDAATSADRNASGVTSDAAKAAARRKAPSNRSVRARRPNGGKPGKASARKVAGRRARASRSRVNRVRRANPRPPLQPPRQRPPQAPTRSRIPARGPPTGTDAHREGESQAARSSRPRRRPCRTWQGAALDEAPGGRRIGLQQTVVPVDDTIGRSPADAPAGPRRRCRGRRKRPVASRRCLPRPPRRQAAFSKPSNACRGRTAGDPGAARRERNATYGRPGSLPAETAAPVPYRCTEVGRTGLGASRSSRRGAATRAPCSARRYRRIPSLVLVETRHAAPAPDIEEAPVAARPPGTSAARQRTLTSRCRSSRRARSSASNGETAGPAPRSATPSRRGVGQAAIAASAGSRSPARAAPRSRVPSGPARPRNLPDPRNMGPEPRAPRCQARSRAADPGGPDSRRGRNATRSRRLCMSIARIHAKRVKSSRCTWRARSAARS